MLTHIPSSFFPFQCSLFSAKLLEKSCLSSCLHFFTFCSFLDPLPLGFSLLFSALLSLLLLRSLVTSMLSQTVTTCPPMCYLIFKQHLIELTSPSSLKHSFTLGLHNVTLCWLWGMPFRSSFMRLSYGLRAD